MKKDRLSRRWWRLAQDSCFQTLDRRQYLVHRLYKGDDHVLMPFEMTQLPVRLTKSLMQVVAVRNGGVGFGGWAVVDGGGVSSVFSSSSVDVNICFSSGLTFKLSSPFLHKKRNADVDSFDVAQ
ncbi:hypothetical protein DPEC_G00176270 [Dallia pectoralis]|uniref:Uncharacterized protein n=1 Tax=Dallia pectoralis TaxID=75939 RepID=A0ACC2GEB2_DALPE|nr:hypothetical protein DPEC_G00176270 [Dallia pectoralis]